MDNELDIIKDYKTMSLEDISSKYNVTVNRIVNIIHYHKIEKSKIIKECKELIDETEV